MSACILWASVAEAAGPVCTDSGFAPGLYRYERGQRVIDVQVDESGCAAYSAIESGEVQTTKTFHDQRGGAYDIPYRYNESCRVRGLVVRGDDGKLYAKHTKVEGACLTGISDIVDQAAPWSFSKGAHPSISMRLSAPVEPSKRKRARLSRVSTEIEYRDGEPSLQWEARINANVGVTPIWDAQPSKDRPAANIDALYER